MFRKYFILFCLYYGQNLTAQTDTLKIDTVKVNALEEVEVKAMYSNIVTRRFPATVYAIRNNEGDILLPVNINESLNKIPSIYAHTGSFNTSRITMRGIGTRSLYGTRKINALLNNIPLTSGEGDTFIDDIDLKLIDRIEVIGGPTSGIYGPALGGSILLFSKPLNGKSFLKINSGAGSYGMFQNAVTVDLIKSSSGLSVSYKNVHSDGYRQNNSYNRNSALVNYNFHSTRSEWDFLLLFTDVKAGIPSSIDSFTFENNPRSAAATWAKTKGREDTQRLLTGLTHQYTFSPTLSSFVTIYGLYKKSQEIRPFDILHEDDLSGGVKLHVKKKISKLEGLTLTPGLSVFLEKYRPSLFENMGGVGEKGGKIAENIENIYHANAFLIAEYIPNLKNYISISLNINKIGITDQNIFTSAVEQKYQHNINFSPRISVSHQIMLNHFVFGSISHGLSYPSIQEILYPDGTINNDVKPEKAWSAEIGFKGIQLFNEIKYSMSFYYMPVNDLIVPDRIAEDTYIGKNIGKSLHTGIEILLGKTTSLDRDSWFYLGDYNLSLTLQSNKFKRFSAESDTLINNELPGVPGKKMFISMLFKIKKSFFIEPEIYLNDKTAMNDENSKMYKGYNISNLKFGYKLKRDRWEFKISSAVNNLFNKKYASMILINAPSSNTRPPRFYYPGLPRNYYFSVSAGFQI